MKVSLPLFFPCQLAFHALFTILHGAVQDALGGGFVLAWLTACKSNLDFSTSSDSHSLARPPCYKMPALNIYMLHDYPHTWTYSNKHILSPFLEYRNSGMVQQGVVAWGSLHWSIFLLVDRVFDTHSLKQERLNVAQSSTAGPKAPTSWWKDMVKQSCLAYDSQRAGKGNSAWKKGVKGQT